MNGITRIDPYGRSAQNTLEEALADNPDQALVVLVKEGKVKVMSSGDPDRLWIMGALSAAMVEQWVYDS